MSTPRRLRLDAELVRRRLARSREHAATLIAEGRVTVSGQPAHKSATQVEAVASIVVSDVDAGPDYVSRGAHKLLGAFAAFQPGGLAVEEKVCLDAGASTGGFTDVLLRAGASHVFAVDVGYGQLAWPLQTDHRVTVRDRCNVRGLTSDSFTPRPQVVVADLSFISLRMVLPALRAAASPDADLVLMVKPQFEVGRERLGSGGVVRDPALRAAMVVEVGESAYALGLGTLGVTASPLPGPAGNVEFFLWLREGAPRVGRDAVDDAVRRGPA